MKMINFENRCPTCCSIVMISSAPIAGKNESHLFSYASDGFIYFDLECAFCKAKFKVKHSIMGLLLQCDEKDEVVSIARKRLYIFRRQIIL